MDGLYRLRIDGDPVLHRTAAPVERFDASLAELAARMSEVRIAGGGVGIAAPQVGVGLRVFTMVDRGVELVVVNPELRLGPGVEEAVEGCLSMPGRPFPVRRAEAVLLTGFDVRGRRLRLDLFGWSARVAQHEVDHLDGILIADRARLSGLSG